MPAFIDAIVASGRTLGTLYETVAQKIDKENYYTDHDTALIQVARRIYLEIFKDRPLPSELRYHHEPKESNAVLQAVASPIPYRYYKPPYLLQEAYSSRGLVLGENEISEKCREAILYIQGYMSALNGKASSFISYLPYVQYGHKSDAIRFMFFLLMNAFVELSKMNLKVNSSLEEASGYIEFLNQLKLTPELDRVFMALGSFKMKMPEGNKVVTPLSMLTLVHDELDKVKKVIVYRISTCSIAEQTHALKQEVDKLVLHGVTFSTFIVSQRKMAELAMVTADRTQPATDENELLNLQRELKEALRKTNPNLQTEQAAGVLQITGSVTPAATEGLYYDEKLTKWVGVAGRALTSGVYKGFSQVLIQDFIKFCVQLKLLGELRLSVMRIQTALGTGGDLIAVTLFSADINLALRMLTDTLGEMQGCRERILEFAKAHHDQLSRKNNHEWSNDEKAWRANFNEVTQLLPNPRVYAQIIEDFSSSISLIRMKMQAWDNPQEKIEEFRANQYELHLTLEATGRRIARFKPSYHQLIEQWRSQGSLPALSRVIEITNRQPIVQRALTQRPSIHVIEVLDDDMPVVSTRAGQQITNTTLRSRGVFASVEEIKNKLIVYSSAHGYRFNLRQVHDSILLRNPGRMQKHTSIYDEYRTDNAHQARRVWIYDAFEVLYSEDTEQEILRSIQAHIEQLYVPSWGPARLVRERTLNEQFTSGSESGMEACIEQAARVITERLTKIERVVLPAESIHLATPGVPVVPNVVTRDYVEMQSIFSPREAEPVVNPLSHIVISTERSDPSSSSAVASSDSMTEMTYTGIVADIKYWIEECREVDSPERINLFLSFWNSLTFLEQSNFWDAINPFERKRTTRRLERYDHQVILMHSLVERQTFLRQIQSGLESATQGQWAQSAVRDLAGGAAVEDPKIWVIRKLSQIQQELLRGNNQLRGEHKKTLKADVVMDEPEGEWIGIAWPNQVYRALIKTVQDLNHDMPGLNRVARPNAMPATEFVDAISHRLLQRRNPLYAAAAYDNETNQLDKYLCDILTHHQEPLLTEELRAFYIHIARGLMHLGATPRLWMQQQASASSLTIAIDAKNAAGYFLAAEQARLILSHLQYRASRLGECQLFLSHELEDLSQAFIAFADRLNECVRSDQDLSWRFHAWCQYGDKPRPLGARYERAALIWAGLEFIYTIVDDKLREYEDDPAQREKDSEAFAEVKGRLDQAKEIYAQATAEPMPRYNRGTATFANLMSKIEVVLASITRQLLAQRKMHYFSTQRQDAIQAKDAALAEAAVARQEARAQEQKIRAQEQKMMIVIQTQLTKELEQRFVDAAMLSEAWVRQQFNESIKKLHGDFKTCVELSVIEGVGCRIVYEDESLAEIRRFIAPPATEGERLSAGLQRYGTFPPPVNNGLGSTSSAGARLSQ